MTDLDQCRGFFSLTAMSRCLAKKMIIRMSQYTDRVKASETEQ